MVRVETMDHSPSNCSVSPSVSDPDKTLTVSFLSLDAGCSTNSNIAHNPILVPNQDTEDDGSLFLPAHIETRDYDSVVSANVSDSSLPPSPAEYLDDMCLVPVPGSPKEALTDYNGDRNDCNGASSLLGSRGCIEEDAENEHNLETNGLLSEYSSYHSCNCNGLLNQWPGTCGSSCKYRFSRFNDPCYPSREQWRNREDEEDMPCWLPVQETVPTGVGAGLYNLGNTCFINAILQCFTHTVPLVEAIRSCNHLTPCQRGVEGFCVVCALRDHIELSLASSGKAISPSKVVENLNHISACFQKYQQEDAHEFLQCLLDKLERCCLDPNKTDKTSSSRDDNIVELVFGGRLISKLRCCNCSHISDKYEPLIDLSLEIEDVETLQNALDSFTKVEKIEDVDTKFICDHCKEDVSREKQLMLDQAPPVATLHLKRFKTDGSSVEKIDKHVEFPLELDLKPYTSSSKDCNENQVDLKYQLYAVVVHSGLLPTSGHYFCYVRSSPSTWHKLDDSRVVKVEEEKVLCQSAYILFYVRDRTPWFSSLIEPQKHCLDSSISTSPKSVLDRMLTDAVAYPHWENLEHCKASVTKADIEITSNFKEDQINENGKDGEGISSPICCGSIPSGSKLHCEELNGDISMNDVSLLPEAGYCPDGVLHDENLAALPSVEENNCCQGANKIRTIQTSRCSNPDLKSGGLPESRHHVRQGHLKVEHSINFKAKKGTRDQRTEALRCIRKMPVSRGMKLMDAMLPRNDNKRLKPSLCKQASPPGGRARTAHRSALMH